MDVGNNSESAPVISAIDAVANGFFASTALDFESETYHAVASRALCRRSRALCRVI